MTNDLFYSRDQAKALRFSFGELNCSGGGFSVWFSAVISRYLSVCYTQLLDCCAHWIVLQFANVVF